MNKKDIFIGDAEANPHELFMDTDGEWRVVSKEEVSKHLINLPKGTKVLSNDETAQCIQSWYENRRD